MATGNALYPKWKQALVTEALTLKSLDQGDAANGVYCALVTIGGANYVYSQAHQFYTDLGANVQGVPLQVTAPTVSVATVAGSTGLVFDGNDCTFISVAGTIGAVVLYRHNPGANTTWRLVYYLDTVTSGLPVTPAGGNLVVSWNPNGIFMF
jgi:hypothetical protein